MKHLFTILITLMISIGLNAQCPPSNYVFDSQQKIDDFPTNYPNCTSITYLKVKESTSGDITNLDSLSQLTSVGEDLIIEFNNALTNIDGLSQIISVGGDISVFHNPLITNIDGLSQITSVGGDISISSDDALTNIDGLSQITSVVGDLFITNHNALTNIDGLSQITSIGGNIFVSGDDALTNLNGLSQITSVGGNLNISNNDALTNLNGLSQITSIAGYLYINSNISLTNLDGLSQITSVGGTLSIKENEVLTNLDGLSQISSVGGSIYIENNDALTNLDGLSQITSVDFLYIDNNPLITNLDGLSQITSVAGYLSIAANDALTNLDGLSQVTSVGGGLYINANPLITNLDGLSQITSVGGYLFIKSNASLTNLDGLSQITTVGGGLDIYYNVSLTNLDGLSQITSLGGYLRLEYNESLANLDGLSQITSISGYLRIDNNDILSDISGISNIDANTINAYGDDLLIYNNPVLAVCEVQSICDFIDLANGDPDLTTDIHDNASGCNSEAEVDAACPSLPVCTMLNSPLNGDSNVEVDTDLSWDASTDATGYKLVVGTTSGGTDIEDNTDVGNVLSYDPGDFPCGSTIYVTIIPYNAAGDATGCTEESFSTESVTANAGADVEICNGGSIQLSASGGTTYSWSPTIGLDDPYIANPMASPISTTTYTVTVSNNGRCPDTDNITVTVNDATAGVIAPDQTLCDGNPATVLTETSSGNGYGTVSYQWQSSTTDCSLGFADIAGATSQSYDPGVLTQTTYFHRLDTWTTTGGLICGPHTTNCVTITIAPNPVANATATDETGNNWEDGTATANPSGGTPGYTYSWSNGATTQTITGLAPGNYTVTVSDANGCTAEQTVTVAEYICATLTLQISQEDAVCFGDCNGTLTVDGMTNGIAPFTYLWSDGQTTQTAIDLCAGDYTVTVTDAKDCSQVSSTYTITMPDELFANATATNEAGYQWEDGSATANPSGGTSPYTYEWSNGETTQTITGLAPGDYTVTVTDDNGCTVEQTVTVAEYVCATLTINITQENLTCFGGCYGVLTVDSVTNSVGALSYLWSNGETTQSITNLCPDDYTVTITDAKNCSINETFTIIVLDELFANASATDETGNNWEDGTATASPTGGTTPYSYNWSNGEITQTITGLAPGDYTVTVTDDNGCTDEQTVTVAEYICGTLTLQISQEDVFCFGDCDGAITVDGLANGIAPFTYLWSNGQTTQTATNLCAGDYTVTVTDAKDCSEVSGIYTIAEPDELFANASATDETGNNWEDGTATASPTGGTTPYSYKWSNGESLQTITGLAPGDYTVTVIDDNECTAEQTVTVTEYICATLSLDVSVFATSCFEDCNGEITINSVTNGIAPFTYAWSDGGQSTQTATNLCAGNYTVTVTDSKNCSIEETYTVTEPDELFANASTTDETGVGFNDGTASSSPSGGTSPYTYIWNTGETTQNISGLAPGDYTVTVTDDQACTTEETVTVNSYICPALQIIVDQEDASCFGGCDGFLIVNGVTNGVSPFTYSWSNGKTTQSINNLYAGDYSVTVTDTKNCTVSETYTIVEPEELFANASATNETGYQKKDGTAAASPTGGTSPYSYEWSNGEVTQSINGLQSGDYTVTVTDNNNCTAEMTVTVEAFICPTISIESTVSDATCFGDCNGEITITEVTNGVAPFSYEWSNEKTTQTVTNLCAGDYFVTVTDAKNCPISQTYSITEPDELFVNANATDETGYQWEDGTATASPSGGTSPYTYEWSNGEVTQSINGLQPGDYTVTVTDQNGCTSVQSVTIAKYGCKNLTINIDQSNVNCNGQCDGSLDVTGVDNGTSPYTYNWSNGNTSSSINGLCAGTYDVTIVDGNNCSVFGSYSISEPTILVSNATSTDETKNDANDGTANANPTGGTMPYIYLWSTGDTSQMISGLSPGQYTVVVSDNNGCTANDTVNIAEFTCPNLAIDIQSTDVSCFGECDGSLSINNVSNVVLPLSYLWNTGATSASLSNLCVGDYSVTITDAKNCEVVQNYTLTQPDEITITIDSTRDIRLNSLGYIAITTNNNGNYIFSWTGPGNFTAKTENLDSLSDFGCYTLTVTDTTTNCSIDSTICLIDKTATFDLEFGNINIYPNPTKGNFIIDFNNARLEQAEITIFDLSGKQQLNLEKKTTDKILNVEAEVLNAGLYIIRIKSAKFGTSFKKVIMSK